MNACPFALVNNLTLWSMDHCRCHARSQVVFPHPRNPGDHGQTEYSPPLQGETKCQTWSMALGRQPKWKDPRNQTNVHLYPLHYTSAYHRNHDFGALSVHVGNKACHFCFKIKKNNVFFWLESGLQVPVQKLRSIGWGRLPDWQCFLQRQKP